MAKEKRAVEKKAEEGKGKKKSRKEETVEEQPAVAEEKVVEEAAPAPAEKPVTKKEKKSKKAKKEKKTEAPAEVPVEKEEAKEDEKEMKEEVKEEEEEKKVEKEEEKEDAEEREEKEEAENAEEEKPIEEKVEAEEGAEGEGEAEAEAEAEASPAAEGESNTSAFVANIAFSATEDDVRAFFADCGEITNLELNHGKAVVTFATPEGLKKVGSAVGCYQIFFSYDYRLLNSASRNLLDALSTSTSTSLASQAQRPTSHKANLPPPCSWAIFLSMPPKIRFRRLLLNVVTSSQSDSSLIVRLENSRGLKFHYALFLHLPLLFSFGYIEFESEDAAKAAMELNGTEVDGRPIRLDYAQARQGGGDRGGRGGFRGGRGDGRGLLFWVEMPLIMLYHRPWWTRWWLPWWFPWRPWR